MFIIVFIELKLSIIIFEVNFPQFRFQYEPSCNI